MHLTKDRAPKYTRQKQIELQIEVDESIVRIGDFNNFLSEMDPGDRK
jgi:hypothetical protein